jgi:RNA 3'-terminal phosphate cyclase
MIGSDGTVGEGGGQVLRSALTQAQVIRRFLPVRITIDGAPGGPGTVRVDP